MACYCTTAVDASEVEDLEVETVPLLKFDVQKFPAPSRTTANGPPPVENLDAAPVEAFTLVTELTPLLAIHSLLVSEVIPAAPSPTAMVVAVKIGRASCRERGLILVEVWFTYRRIL